MVFISDRGYRTDLNRITYGKYRLCEYHLQTGSLEVLNIFPGADIYGPQYSTDGESIFFISAAQGIQNIYEYDTGNETLYRMTNLPTGVSSISQSSPALSVARNENLMVYVLYEKKGYSIFKARPGDFTREEVNPVLTDLSAASLVPETQPNIPTVVNINLEKYPLEDASRFATKPYKPAFGLEAVSSAGIGIGFDQTNTAAGGGVSLLFSDMLKRNQLYTALRVNGRIIDAGGQVVYINQKNRCVDNECLNVNQITGSKMIITGAEARLPITGPKRLALIRTRLFYTDLVLFMDGGLAWHDFSNRAFSLDPAGDKHIPIFSTGLAVRVNLFGAIILEPYYAIPLQMGGDAFGQFGFYISGGGW